MNNLFPKRLRSLMSAKNITQVELSKAISVNQSTVCSWLSGKKSPKISTLYKIADFFNVSIDYIIGRKNL